MSTLPNSAKPDVKHELPGNDSDPVAAPPAPPAPAATTGPTTPSIPTLQPADAPMGEPGHNEEERLDEALQESMTTSDPVSIKIA